MTVSNKLKQNDPLVVKSQSSIIKLFPSQRVTVPVQTIQQFTNNVNRLIINPTITNVSFNELNQVLLPEFLNLETKSVKVDVPIENETYAAISTTPNTDYVGLKEVQLVVKPLQKLAFDTLYPNSENTGYSFTTTDLDAYSGLYSITFKDVSIKPIDEIVVTQDDIATSMTFTKTFADAEYFGAAETAITVPLIIKKELTVNSTNRKTILKPAPDIINLDGSKDNSGKYTSIGMKSVILDAELTDMLSGTSIKNMAKAGGGIISPSGLSLGYENVEIFKTESTNINPPVGYSSVVYSANSSSFGWDEITVEPIEPAALIAGSSDDGIGQVDGKVIISPKKGEGNRSLNLTLSGELKSGDKNYYYALEDSSTKAVQVESLSPVDITSTVTISQSTNLIFEDSELINSNNQYLNKLTVDIKYVDKTVEQITEPYLTIMEANAAFTDPNLPKSASPFTTELSDWTSYFQGAIKMGPIYSLSVSSADSSSSDYFTSSFSDELNFPTVNLIDSKDLTASNDNITFGFKVKVAAPSTGDQLHSFITYTAATPDSSDPDNTDNKWTLVKNEMHLFFSSSVNDFEDPEESPGYKSQYLANFLYYNTADSTDLNNECTKEDSGKLVPTPGENEGIGYLFVTVNKTVVDGHICESNNCYIGNDRVYEDANKTIPKSYTLYSLRFLRYHCDFDYNSNNNFFVIREAPETDNDPLRGLLSVAAVPTFIISNKNQVISN